MDSGRSAELSRPDHSNALCCERGDIIVADDDVAVVVPIALAEDVLKRASQHAEWEGFSKLRLSQGGDLRKYYPLTAEVEGEHLEWRAAQDALAKKI